MEERWTIGRLVQWTTEYLRQRGSSTPRLDAEILLAHALGCQRIDLYTQYDNETNEAVRSRFRELVRRRAAGEPVAYLVGGREFFSLWFEVNREVLIPRPETEFVVTAILDAGKSFAGDELITVCDVGTGSGIIAVCVAKFLPQAQVTAIDISEEALEVARRNAKRHDVAERIKFVRSNLLEALPSEERFHVIASNPPYVREEEFSQLPPDVRDFEPRTALVAGKEGTEVIEALVGQVVDRLLPGGWLIMEIAPHLAQRVEKLLAGQLRLELVEIRRDLARLPRVVVARLRS